MAGSSLPRGCVRCLCGPRLFEGAVLCLAHQGAAPGFQWAGVKLFDGTELLPDLGLVVEGDAGHLHPWGGTGSASTVSRNLSMA